MEFIVLDKKNVEQYIDGIAKVHFNAYSKWHFTSCFSKEKLKAYYQDLINCSDLSIVAFNKNAVIGFIVAGLNVSKGVTKFTVGNRLYLAILLLTHPNFLIQKVLTKFTSKFNKTKPSEANFRLLSIAVSTNQQSNGIGTQMLSFFETTLKERGVLKYGLSVRSLNKSGVRFYERNGFLFEKEVNKAKYYVKNLSKEALV